MEGKKAACTIILILFLFGLYAETTKLTSASYLIKMTISGTDQYAVSIRQVKNDGSLVPVEGSSLEIPMDSALKDRFAFLLSCNQYGAQFTYKLSWKALKHTTISGIYIPYTLVVKRASAVVATYAPGNDPTVIHESDPFTVKTKETGSGRTDYEICTVAIGFSEEASTALAGSYADTITLTLVTS